MANTLKFGNGEWYGKKDTILAYNDLNSNYKPLPFNFSRASSATRVNKDGLIETVGSGQPRIDYKDDSEGALLLEPSRSNTITYSNDFLDSSWNVFRGSVTADVIISPDGTQNASRYEEDSQTGSHLFRRQSLSITNGLSYTGSVFAKKGELSSIILKSNSSSRWVASATFDVENGVVTSGTGEIEDYGNGWYRCSISGNAVQTTTAAGLEMYTSVGAGRDGDGLYMYGAMFEQGSYATSYIPTSGSAVTRVQDTCSQTVPDGVIGQTEGSIYSEFKSLDDVANLILWMRNPSGGNYGDMIKLECGGDNRLRFEVRASNVTSCSFIGDVLPTNIYYKVAVAYKQNDFVVYINGVQIGVDTSGNVPTCSEMYIGKYVDGGVRMGVVKDLKLYNTRLSNSELQALTQ